MTPLRGGRTLALLGRHANRPPRVAHLVDTLEVGSVASLVAAACEHLPAREIPCYCICLDSPGDHAGARVPDEALVSLRVGNRPFARRLLALVRALQQLRVDILHTHGSVYGDALAAAPLGRVPVLIHEEIGETGGPGERLLRAGRLLTGRFLASSRHAAAALGQRAGVGADRIRLLSPGVDTGRFRPDLDREQARHRLGAGTSEVLIGSVGRLIPSRNYAVLLESMALMRSEGADVRCLLVGDGLETDTLSHQARQLGIADRLHLTGLSHDVPALLSAMDIFVLPSSSDHLPQSLLEAMAVGLPVVVGSGGPITEVIRDGDNGLLVPADRPRILARILHQLGDSPSRRSALGARARRSVEQHWSLDPTLDELARIYRDLVS